MRVRLIKDLSQYDEHLVVGAEGIARENKVTFTAWEQPMVEVKIPGAKALPIGWNALEIIDKDINLLLKNDEEVSYKIYKDKQQYSLEYTQLNESRKVIINDTILE